LKINWLETTGFHQSTPLRGIAVAKKDQIDSLLKDNRITIYQPVSKQMGPLY
jgi:hypothetical protein